MVLGERGWIHFSGHAWPCRRTDSAETSDPARKAPCFGAFHRDIGDVFTALLC